MLAPSSLVYRGTGASGAAQPDSTMTRRKSRASLVTRPALPVQVRAGVKSHILVLFFTAAVCINNNNNNGLDLYSAFHAPLLLYVLYPVIQLSVCVCVLLMLHQVQVLRRATLVQKAT